MPRHGVRRTPDLPAEGHPGLKSFFQLLVSGLAISPVDRSTTNGSYAAAALHSFLITAVSSLLAFVKMSARVDYRLTLQSALMFLLRNTLLLFVAFVTFTFLITMMNCNFLGISPISGPLDWQIAVASLAYFPLYVLGATVNSLLGHAMGVALCGISVVYIFTSYKSIHLEDEGALVTHHVFVSVSVILAVIVLSVVCLF